MPRARPLQPHHGDNVPDQRIQVQPRSCTAPASAVVPPSAVVNQLRSVFQSIKQNPPAQLYRQVCHSLAVTLLETEAPAWETAYYMVESQSVTFRHKALLSWKSRLRKLEKDEADASTDNGQQQKECLLKLREEICFNKNPDSLEQSVRSLPADWAVCQISVVSVPGHRQKHLLVSRFTAGEEPVVIRMEGFMNHAQTQDLLQQYSSIFQRSSEAVVQTDRAQWWKDRYALDGDVKVVLEKMEHQWLGCWKGVLHGCLCNDEDQAKLTEAVNTLVSKWTGIPLKHQAHQRIKLLLQAYPCLNERECIQGILSVCDGTLPSPDGISKRLEAFHSVAKAANLGICSHGPVILVLDKDIQHLPWENFPSLQAEQMTRMPSVYFVSSHYHTLTTNRMSVLSQGVESNKTFYIVDPDSNLPATREKFQEWFEQKQGWQGLVNRSPTPQEFADGISGHDLFIYCGHGSGAKYLSQDCLEMTNCHATSLLMGCSSGKLVASGDLEASGIMLHYFMAGAPCMVGCLWDVTDRDIDRYTEELLKTWLGSRGQSILDVVEAGRSACKLRYLTAAAPVVYGLPVHISKKTVGS